MKIQMFTWAGRIVALDVLVVEDSRVSLRPGDQLPSCHPLQKQAEGKHSGHPRFWRFSTNMAFHRCPKENLCGFSPDTSQVTSGHIAMFNVSQHLKWAETWSTYSHYPSSATQWCGLASSGIAKYSRRSSMRRHPVSTDVGAASVSAADPAHVSELIPARSLPWCVPSMNQLTTQYML